jgi:hypothetical protein
LIEELNPVLRGWELHYKRAQVRKLFHRLDDWIVRRIRVASFKRYRTPFLYRGRPENLKIILGAVVVWHLLLWKAAPLRRFWHGALRYSGLRPGDLG